MPNTSQNQHSDNEGLKRATGMIAGLLGAPGVALWIIFNLIKKFRTRKANKRV